MFVCVWSSVGNGSFPVGPVVHLVHLIRAFLPPQHTVHRAKGFWQGQVPNHRWLRLTLVGIGLIHVSTYPCLFDTAFLGATVP